MSVATPAGFVSTVGGDLPFPVRERKGLNIDLKAARLVRAVGHVTPVGREVGVYLIRGRSQKLERLLVTTEGNQPYAISAAAPSRMATVSLGVLTRRPRNNNRRLQLLGQAFRVAIQNKTLSLAPFVPRLSELGNERQGFFETADFEAVVAKLPEYLRDFSRFGFVTGWRKGSIESLRWADVGEGVIYLRAKNSKTRKPETMPLEGELQDIIERRREAAVLKSEDAPPRFAEFVFHRNGQPIGTFARPGQAPASAPGWGK